MGSNFDFEKYLSNLFPTITHTDLEIEPLTGGLTNFTVRVSFNGRTISLPEESSQSFSSIIVKHAPPYIASIGPAQSLSTRRQVIEATALRLFSNQTGDGEPKVLAEVLRRHRGIRIPELLYHDEKNSILIMSDLGKLPTLSDYLKLQSPTVNFAAILGNFLADLYSSTRGSSLGPLADLFENESISVTIGELIGTIPEKLLKSYGVLDAEALGRAIRKDLSNQSEQEQCFGMVDLWPGSILIGTDFVGLVDWEYSGISASGSELGMLTAHLHIPLLSPIVRVAHSEAIHSFVGQLLSSKFSHNSASHSIAFTRSALLAHGRELINAVEFQAGELEGETHKKNLMQAGERCIRAALCEDPETRAGLLTSEEKTFLAGLI